MDKREPGSVAFATTPQNALALVAGNRRDCMAEYLLSGFDLDYRVYFERYLVGILDSRCYVCDKTLGFRTRPGFRFIGNNYKRYKRF